MNFHFFILIFLQDAECASKRWLPVFERSRRGKEEDPIIPFGEGPIISKWGAISRASRTDHHSTEPVQATAAHGRNNTTLINFRGVAVCLFIRRVSHLNPKLTIQTIYDTGFIKLNVINLTKICFIIY